MDMYVLPPGWEDPIQGWVAWMTAAGLSRETVRLRRGHLRVTARRLATASPFTVSGPDLITMCATVTWSNDHRRGMRSALNSFYAWSAQAGLTVVNPAAVLPKVAESKPHPRPVTDQIWAQLLEQARPREVLMARLAAEAGLRRAEVARVHADDLVDDLVGRSLIVRGKGGRQRIVPVTDSLAAAVAGYRRRGFLFPGQIDGHISPNHVGVLISRLMPAGWSMHKLRHRFASRGLAGTGNLRAVQEALGHASVATTQRYTAVSSADVRAVAEAAA